MQPLAINNVKQELEKTAKEWDNIHQHVMQSSPELRERLLFEEQQLEKHMYRVLDSYHCGIVQQSFVRKDASEYAREYDTQSA